MTNDRRAAWGVLVALVACLFSVPALALVHPTPAVASPSPPVPHQPVVAWGMNFLGEAGNGGYGDQHAQSGSTSSDEPYNDYPVQASGLTDVIAVSAAWESSAAIVRGRDRDGTPDPSLNTVWMWGQDLYGELGSRPPDVCQEPDLSPTLNDQHAIAGYWNIPCAQRPVQVRGPGGSGYLTGIVAIADGGDHVLALRSDGTVWVWGASFPDGDLGVSRPSTPNPACPPGITLDGQPFNSVPYCVPFPEQLPGLTGVTAVAASELMSLAVVHKGGPGPDDTVWVWGDNSQGELGQGWDCEQARGCGASTPTEVPGLHDVAALSVGSGTVMAVVRGSAADGSDNQLWTWGGDNRTGASGVSVDGPVRNPDPFPGYRMIDQPTRVLDASGSGYFTGAVAVTTTGGFTVAVRAAPTLRTTTVWNWGAQPPPRAARPAAYRAPKSPTCGSHRGRCVVRAETGSSPAPWRWPPVPMAGAKPTPCELMAQSGAGGSTGWASSPGHHRHCTATPAGGHTAPSRSRRAGSSGRRRSPAAINTCSPWPARRHQRRPW